MAAIAIFIVILGLSPFSGVAQSPVTVPVVSPSGGMNINGQPAVAGSVGDWIPGTGTGGYLVNSVSETWQALNTTTTKFVRDPFNGSDRILSGKTNANPNTGWKWSTGKATAKCDIGVGFFHTGLTSGENGNQWVFLAGDRLTTNGTSYIDFQFMQGFMRENANGTFSYTTDEAGTLPAPDGGRIAGDIVLSMAYSNGGSSANVLLYIWKNVNGVWGFQQQDISMSMDNVVARTHTNVVNAAYLNPNFGQTNSSYKPYQFVEGAVNVNGLLEDVDPCASVAIKTLMIVTKQSDAFSAELADYVEPQRVELTFGKPEVVEPAAQCNYGTLALRLSDNTPLVKEHVTVTSLTEDVDDEDLVFTASANAVVDLGASVPGRYQITYQLPSIPGACPEPSDPIILEIKASPEQKSVTGSTTCSPTKGTITVESPQVNTFYTILHENGAAVAGKDPIQFVTNQVIAWSGLDAGTYGVSAELNGCTANMTDTGMVVINDLPSLSFEDPDAVCAPNTVDLTTIVSDEDLTLTYWSNALGTIALENPDAIAEGGTYYIKATNVAGCSTIENVDVTINPEPSLVITNPGAVCAPSTVDLTAAAVTAGSELHGGTLTYFHNEDPLTNSAAAAVSQSGIYKIKVTTGAGCEDIANVDVTVNSEVAAATFCIIQPTLCGEPTGTIHISSPIGIGYLYSIDGGANYQAGTSFTGLLAGSNPSIKVKLGDCTSVPSSCTGKAVCEPESEAPAQNKTNNTSLASKESVTAQSAAKTVHVEFEEMPEISAYPNPFRENVNFRFVSPVSGQATLQIVNAQGQVMAVPFRGAVQAGIPSTINYRSTAAAGIMHYRLVVAGKTLHGKVVKQ